MDKQKYVILDKRPFLLDYDHGYDYDHLCRKVERVANILIN